MVGSFRPFATQQASKMKAAYFYLANAVTLGLLSFSSGLKEKLTTPVKEIWKASSIKVPENLINKSVDANNLPRCGVTDPRDFAILPGRAKFPNTDLTYRIRQHTPDLTDSEVNNIIANALNTWARVTPLTFTQTTSTADIEITFASRDHGDSSPFDGSGGVLAHAFGPGTGIGGDIHFDEDETWTTNSDDFNLFLVAVHEAGHSLGLDHSEDPNSVMAPIYKYVNTEGYTLPQDDVNGIQSLYGPLLNSTAASTTPLASSTQKSPASSTQTTTKQPTQTTTKQPTQTPPTCDPNLYADAVLKIGRTVIYFKDGFTKSSLSPRISRVQDIWPGGPSNVDAAFAIRWRNWKTYLFQGSQYWRFERNVLDSGYPKPIRNFGFANSVQKIDAAMRINRRTILFFVGNQLWRYRIGVGMIRGSPVPLRQVFRQNDNVDAAVKYRGNYYLISRRNLYIYDQRFRLRRVFRLRGWLNCL
ncbi:neutrophil collagenase-like [Pristis pectinata]|uniref:neutrophil collagenase-like n=1 Tax=Pristis pectinata TaxID=685728 RepID=UPI00223E0BC4|nr:neutrophil collagenase-like [Pristis pectinata]